MAGKDRNELVPHLAVFKGSLDDPHSTVFERPDFIRMSVEYALKLASDKRTFKEKPGEVMGQLAFAHSFLDGNGRSILLLFMELSYRAGFTIDWSRTSKDLYLQALSDEIRDPFKGHYLQALAAMPETEATSAEQQYLMFELLTRIDALLDGLAPNVRSAFLLPRLEGLTYSAIAVQLKVSVLSVEKYIAKAVRHCYLAQL